MIHSDITDHTTTKKIYEGTDETIRLRIEIERLYVYFGVGLSVMLNPVSFAMHGSFFRSD